MKNTDVPQDQSNLKENNLKELCYAVNQDGIYTTELSSGWEPKTIVQKETIKQIEERVARAKKAVSNGEVSPIVYYMELHKMDLNTLVAYVEMWRWRVKRHFKPKVFKRLNEEILNRYAVVFEISVTELKQFEGK